MNDSYVALPIKKPEWRSEYGYCYSWLNVSDVLKQVAPSEPAFYNTDGNYYSRIVVNINGISPG